MTEICVIKFLDESLHRFAPLDLIRLKNKQKFAPASARDLPEENVLVKWQKSMVDGSFQDDGYYEAEILAIAGSVKTAQAKAQEMNLRLHSPALLALPSSKSSASNSSRRRKARQSASPKSEKKSHESNVSKSDVSKSSKATVNSDNPKSSKPAVKSDVSKGLKSFIKSDSKDSKPKAESLGAQDLKPSSNKSGWGSSLKRSKSTSPSSSSKKRLKLDDVALERTAEQSKLAESNNPLFKNKTSIATYDPMDAYMDMIENPSSVDDLIDSVHGSPASNDSDGDSQGSKKILRKSKHSTSPASSDNSQDSKDIKNNSVPFSTANSNAIGDDSQGSEDNKIKLLSSKRTYSGSDHSSQDSKLTSQDLPVSPSHNEEEDDLDSTIPLNNAWKDLAEPLTSTSGSDTGSTNESEDEDEVSKLCNDKKRLQKSLSTLKEKLAEAERNLTLTNNLRLAHLAELKKLRNSLQDRDSEVQKLEKRNGALQDLLSQNSVLGSSSGRDGKIKESQKGKDKHSSKKVESRRKEYHPSGKKSPKHHDSLLTIDNSGEFLTSPEKRTIKDSPIKVRSTEKSPKEQSKKTKGDDLKNPDVNLVCNKVLKHLREEEKLTANEKGFVNLGLDVYVDKAGLQKNFEEHKGDIPKFAKSMAALTWTTTQREERSLEGGKNNRFPNAPAKKAATPRKVNACLGVLKAHLLHMGDKEGPGMVESLKSCRKAIGAKFAQDYTQAKKRSE